MSTPRAIRPLFGVGSRLLVDPFLPKPARSWGAANTLFAGASPTTTGLRHGPSSICWNFQYLNSAKQVRFSSSSSPKDPNDPLRDPLASSSSSSSSELPSSFTFSPPSSSNSTAPDALNQEFSSSESQVSETEKVTTEKPTENEPEQSSSSSSTPLDLPSALNSRRSALNKSLSAFMDRAQTTLFTASQRINDLTGYSSIETLKTQISTLEAQLRTAQSDLTNARSAYKSAVADRSSTQREVTTLLARQKTWTPIDFERFTTLYRQDYELEASVGARATELEQAEHDAERLSRELGASILARYHEEQIWSDKIRRMSTWGTWGLMGVNILLFLLLQFGAEPWRRRRLVRGFEEKVREAIAEERKMAMDEADRISAAAAVAMAAEDEAKAAAAAAAAAPQVPVSAPVSEPDMVPAPSAPWISWREALQDPEYWRATFSDLISDRKIAMRMRDISLIAVEGAALGAAMVGTLAVIVFRRT